MKALSSLILACVLLVAGGLPLSACPNCKEAVAAQPEEGARMADGYNKSILIMMSMPFLLIGAGAAFAVRAVKRGVLPPL